MTKIRSLKNLLNQDTAFVNGVSKMVIKFTTHIKHNKVKNILITIQTQDPKKQEQYAPKLISILFQGLKKQFGDQVQTDGRDIFIYRSPKITFQDVVIAIKKLTKKMLTYGDIV